MSTNVEYDVSLIYFLLRTVLAFTGLISTMLKIPAVVYGVRFIVLYVSNKSASGGEPMDKPPEESDEKPPSLPVVEIILNGLFLLTLFIAVLVTLIRTVYKILRNNNGVVYPYLMVMGVWILFILVSVLADGWSGPLNYAILAAKILLTGWDGVVDASASWYFIFLRISIVLDMIAYPAMIGVLILNYRYPSQKEDKAGLWAKLRTMTKII
ncbi:uncharacterized protein LOC141854890 [Brevipalpus obovatus]|uniref:uncharacterized protein LOC141854890 n=1 Tax=Brevipalpus obovatus TaxID=246614 RepID=UPI003D9DEED3